MGKHLVFVAHDKEEKEGDIKIIRPEIGGSSGNDLIKELDLVGYMEAVGKSRTISFDPCEKFYGKNTCQLDSLITLPALAPGTPNNTLTTIFLSYQAALENRKKVAVSYNELMEVIAGKIESITDAATANDVVEWTTNYQEHIWDSKLQASMSIRNKAKELALILNKDSKRYEAKEAPAQTAANTTESKPAAENEQTPAADTTNTAQPVVTGSTESGNRSEVKPDTSSKNKKNVQQPELIS